MNPLFAPRPGLFHVEDVREAFEPPAFSVRFRGSVEVPGRQRPAIHWSETRTFAARDFAAKAGALRVVALADEPETSPRTLRPRRGLSATYVPRHVVEATDGQPLAQPEHVRRFRAWLNGGAVGSTTEDRRVAVCEAWAHVK